MTWLAHVKAVKSQMIKSGEFKKGDNLSKVLKHASKTYKKRGGDGEETAPTAGRRRRTSKKTRRVKKH